MGVSPGRGWGGCRQCLAPCCPEEMGLGGMLVATQPRCQKETPFSKIDS